MILKCLNLQSTEYRDSSVRKVKNLADVDSLQRSSLSAEDSADLFCEDSGKCTDSNGKAID